ncbi:MAG TPA: HD domain-containing protein, partial [Verrucomicrobiae bacterium]|nr:HD domain-containing protein [Verrucomicrobiae bacterium]
HDHQHAVYVARLGYLIALEQKLELPELKELIYAAGLLHDIGRWKEYQTGEDHAWVSAEFAEPILARAGFSPWEIDIVCAGIREHREPGGSQIGKILALADDLSRNCRGCTVKESCYKLDNMLKIQDLADF